MKSLKALIGISPLHLLIEAYARKAAYKLSRLQLWKSIKNAMGMLACVQWSVMIGFLPPTVFRGTSAKKFALVQVYDNIDLPVSGLILIVIYVGRRKCPRRTSCSGIWRPKVSGRLGNSKTRHPLRRFGASSDTPDASSWGLSIVGWKTITNLLSKNIIYKFIFWSHATTNYISTQINRWQ